MTLSHVFQSTILAMGIIAVPYSAYAHGSSSKSHVDETHAVRNFDKIEIGGVYELDVKVGGEFSVETSGHAKEVEGMKVYVDGNTLVIEHKKNNFRNRMKSKNGVVVTISMPELNAVEIGGVGTGNISGIDSERLTLEIGGVGEMDISGKCKSLEIEVAGVGELDARDLECEDVEVELAGVGEIDVYASKSVDVEAAGVGEVNVYGNPKDVSKSKTFLSEINIR
jgi:hypothetical protein